MKDPKEKEQESNNLMLRLRGLPLAEALRVARTGDVQERMALERLHGKLAWEALLRNPSLTIPEVIRIAGMGLLPGPLLDMIVGNAAWLANEQVRRTLLQNRALKGQAVVTVLRSLPKSELDLVTKQAAYGYNVREAAKRLLGK